MALINNDVLLTGKQFKNQYFENTVEPSANNTIIQNEHENRI